MNIFKKLRLDKIATAFLLATVLLITTACNSGDRLGARPHNPPVQAGGQNNPHKAGGDGMTKYKATNDPKITGNLDDARLPSTNFLAAANQNETTYPTDDNKIEGLLYSNKEEVKSLNNVNDFVSPQTREKLLDPTQIPAVRQPTIDRADPNNKLLEKTQQIFDDAGDF